MYLDPNHINPEAVEQSAADVMGEKLYSPRAYFSEVRADWKFMKDSGDMLGACNAIYICSHTCFDYSLHICRNC